MSPPGPTVRHVPLSGDTLRRLQDALDAAFDVDGVARLLQVTWNRKLENIVPPGSTGEQVMRGVVLWALQARDVGLHGLLAAAVAENPTNPELKKLAAEWDGVVFDAPALPYPGMHPFTEENRARFFGRAGETAQALDLLRRHPFLAIIGPSGSGKSSLLAAGIVPGVQESPAFAGATWKVVPPVRPGARPLENLADALGMDAATLSDGHELPPLPEGTRRLLVVDQFEELFTTAPADQRGPFMTALQRAMAQPCTLTLLAARADFYADLMASPLWPAIRDHRLEIVPPRGDALRAAIAQPAEDVGVTLDPALVERLLADAGDEPGVLPFVQETLVMLWGRMAGLRIGLAEYEDLVGDRSGRSGLEVALARHADGVYTSELADETQRAIARRILLRLIQFGEGRSDTRRQRPVDALRAAGDDPAAFDATLAALAANRLVTLGDSGAGARTVDLAHEALIRGWPLLGEWIARWRAAEQTRQRLEEKAAERDRLRAQGEGGLLDAVELAEAEDWLASPDAAELGMSAALVRLAHDSRAALDAVTREKEEIARRELEQARALAESERKRAEVQTAANASLRRRTLVISVVGVLAVVAAAIAFLQWGEAQRQTDVAVAALAEANVRATAQAQAEIMQREAQRGELLALQQAHERAVQAEQEAASARAELLASKAQELMNDGIVGDRPLLLARDAVLATWGLQDQFVTVSADAALRSAVDKAAWRMTLPSSQTESVGRINEIGLSPDGVTFASAGSDGVVRVWDVATGEQVLALTGLDSEARAVGYSPDGGRIVGAGSNGRLLVWNAQSGEQVQLLEGYLEGVLSASFDVDGARVVTVDGGGTVRVWDVASAVSLLALKPQESGASSAAYSPDGAYIVTGCWDGIIRVWDSESGEVLQTLAGHGGEARSAAYNRTGTRIVSAGIDGLVRVWDAVSGEQLLVLDGHKTDTAGYNVVDSAVFSPDGTRIVSAGWDGVVRVWDAAIGEQKRVLEGNRVHLLAYSPDGSRIFGVSNDGKVVVWATATGEQSRVLEGHRARVYSATYSSDGTRIVSAGQDGTARVWDAVSGRQPLILKSHTIVGITSVAFSPDGKRIASADGEGTVRMWDAETGEQLGIVQWIGDEAGEFVHPLTSSLVYSPNGARVASAGPDGIVRVWDATTGEAVIALHSNEQGAIAAVFSPDGEHMVTDGRDGVVRVWDVATGKQLLVLQTAGFSAHSPAYSPNGARIITVSFDGTVRLWDAASGDLLRALARHPGGATSAVYSPDGTRIVTAGGDGTVRVWDADGGEMLRTLAGHAGMVSSAAFSPDGTRIVSAGADATVRVWDAASIDDLLALAEARIQRPAHVLTGAELAELGLHDLTSSP